MNNRERLNLRYVIWGQRIWNTERRDDKVKPWSQWRDMEDEGDLTANHWYVTFILCIKPGAELTARTGTTYMSATSEPMVWQRRWRFPCRRWLVFDVVPSRPDTWYWSTKLQHQHRIRPADASSVLSPGCQTLRARIPCSYHLKEGLRVNGILRDVGMS